MTDASLNEGSSEVLRTGACLGSSVVRHVTIWCGNLPVKIGQAIPCRISIHYRVQENPILLQNKTRFGARGQCLCIEIKWLLSATDDRMSLLQICSFDIIVENCADRP